MKIYSFPPVSNIDAQTLILGTMPGAKSLSLNQYYGHNDNAFWKIIFTIFNESFSSDYDTKKSILIKNKIALWDVLQVCEKEGSADKAIVKEESNDFNTFFNNHPNIKRIFFNGKKAEEYFNSYSNYNPNIDHIILPSTSSANS